MTDGCTNCMKCFTLFISRMLSIHDSSPADSVTKFLPVSLFADIQIYINVIPLKKMDIGWPRENIEFAGQVRLAKNLNLVKPCCTKLIAESS